jgi:hypothetical protein
MYLARPRPGPRTWRRSTCSRRSWPCTARRRRCLWSPRIRCSSTPGGCRMFSRVTKSQHHSSHHQGTVGGDSYIRRVAGTTQEVVTAVGLQRVDVEGAVAPVQVAALPGSARVGRREAFAALPPVGAVAVGVVAREAPRTVVQIAALPCAAHGLNACQLTSEG